MIRDKRPRRVLAKLLAIVTALIGMVATGIVVAIGRKTVEIALKPKAEVIRAAGQLAGAARPSAPR